MKTLSLVQFKFHLDLYTKVIIASLVFCFGVTPFNLWPLALPALGLGLGLIFSSNSGKAFWKRSLLFFGVHYFVSSYWVINTFNVVVNDDLAAILLGGVTLFMVALAMAFSMTICLFFAWVLLGRSAINTVTAYLVISLFFVLGEILRSEFLGGYPMHFVGYMAGSNDYLIQVAAIGSVFLVSFLLVLVSLFIVDRRRYALYGGCVLSIMFLFGVIKVNVWGDYSRDIKELNVRLVNGNLSQEQLLAKQNTFDVSDHYSKLSSVPPDIDPDLIVWPESVLQYYIQGTYQNQSNAKHLQSFLTDNQVLITGGPSIEDYHSEETTKYFSSLFVLNNKDYLARYDKHRLVPWGEYIPFREWLPKELANLFDVKDYTHGSGELSVKLLNGVDILPLLCAEGHFPQMLWQYQSNQNLIVMIGNEAWFEGTTEPDQYFVNAKFRAVESGLPVLLVSNKGHLAAFDKNGILISHSYKIDEPAVLDTKIKIASRGQPSK